MTPATALQHLVRFGNGSDYKSIEAPEGPYPVYGSGGEFARATEYLHEGESVLFGRKGTVDRPLYVNGRFWTVDTMYYTVPGPQVEPKFLYYWATTIPFDLYSTNTALPSMTSGMLGRLQFPLLERKHQRHIADYLDRETATIDALIEKQMSLIAGLIERRRATVSKSVVTGLHGSAVRCTGDTYFPRIADTWQLQPLGYGYDVVLGKMLDAKRASQDGDTELPYVRAANIKDGYLDLEDVNSMAYTPYEVMRLDLRAGDLLVVEGGSVGQSALLKEPMSGWSFQKTVNRVRSRRQWSTAYLHYVLSHMRARGHFDLICSGSTIAHLTAEKLRAVKIPVPPPAEQREIVAFLDRETAKIDALIAKAERFIELAQERRAALITAAVTGQIEIPTED
ncbi:restriction endonuclease subunit S [Micrococcus luteus]|uniref:restriction endonuclease subunit S n=1 Tax=Micrococcus luteus TaxID=1270 RepID=UPI0035169F8A